MASSTPPSIAVASGLNVRHASACRKDRGYWRPTDKLKHVGQRSTVHELRQLSQNVRALMSNVRHASACRKDRGYWRPTDKLKHVGQRSTVHELRQLSQNVRALMSHVRHASACRKDRGYWRPTDKLKHVGQRATASGTPPSIAERSDLNVRRASGCGSTAMPLRSNKALSLAEK
jgi:hypothetical protein